MQAPQGARLGPKSIPAQPNEGRMSPKPAPNRSGSAPAVLLFLLVVLGGLAAYLWLGAAPSAPIEDATDLGPVTETEVVPEDRIPSSGTFGERTSADEPGVRGPEELGTPAEDPERFEGRGSLAGVVQTTAGARMPLDWTLVIEPSRSLLGRENAVQRRIPMTSPEGATEAEFAVADLPLAGYDVSAEAEGMNARPIPVLLERTSAHAYVMLDLAPAGRVRGFVKRADGTPAEGIDVWLFAPDAAGLDLPGSDARHQVTAPDGGYVFETVLDGAYVVSIGPKLNPLVDPVKVTLQGESLTVPDRTLPELARLMILVLDPQNQPLGGARLRGFGSKGASFDEVSPPNGRIYLENLPPGSYEFTIEHELFAEGRLARRFTGGEDENAVLVLVERP